MRQSETCVYCSFPIANSRSLRKIRRLEDVCPGGPYCARSTGSERPRQGGAESSQADGLRAADAPAVEAGGGDAGRGTRSDFSRARLADSLSSAGGIPADDSNCAAWEGF